MSQTVKTPIPTVKLHAAPGMTQLHIDDHVHDVDQDGRVEVPAHHVEHAIGLGCTHHQVVTPGAEAASFATLSARVDALEAAVAALATKKR